MTYMVEGLFLSSEVINHHRQQQSVRNLKEINKFRDQSCDTYRQIEKASCIEAISFGTGRFFVSDKYN